MARRSTQQQSAMRGSRCARRCQLQQNRLRIPDGIVAYLWFIKRWFNGEC